MALHCPLELYKSWSFSPCPLLSNTRFKLSHPLPSPSLPVSTHCLDHIFGLVCLTMSKLYGKFEDAAWDLWASAFDPQYHRTQPMAQPHLPKEDEEMHELVPETLDEAIWRVKQDVDELFATVERLGNAWVGENPGRNLSQYIFNHFGFTNYLQGKPNLRTEDFSRQHQSARWLRAWVTSQAGKENKAWQAVVGFGGEYLARFTIAAQD